MGLSSFWRMREHFFAQEEWSNSVQRRVSFWYRDLVNWVLGAQLEEGVEEWVVGGYVREIRYQ